MKRLFNTYRRVYKIKNDKTSEEEIEALDSVDESTQLKIYEFSKSIKFSAIDGETEVAIMSDDEFKVYEYYNQLTKMYDESIDITDDIILGKVELEDRITKTIIKPFLKSELNKDIILDKINLTGIESLSELDKKILNS